MIPSSFDGRTAHNRRNTDARTFDKPKLKLRLPNSSARSIVFAACWYAPTGARNESFDSALRRVVLSGKNNGGVTPNVMRHARRRQVKWK